MKIYKTNEFVEKLNINEIQIKDLNNIHIYHYHPKTKDELKSIIKEQISIEGYNCNLNDIDVSNITSMHAIFENSNFIGDISKWDVSNVKDMCALFRNSKFNGDISKWNVSNVITMSSMFYNSQFNQDISNWDVSNVKRHEYIFKDCPLEKYLKKQPKFND